jgi:hypothetical protein
VFAYLTNSGFCLIRFKDIKMQKAYKHYLDGKFWIRIIDENEDEWDESTEGWCEIFNLTNGQNTFRHKDGREIKAV